MDQNTAAFDVPSSLVKERGWRKVVDEAREHGGEARITSHGRVEAVILTPSRYRELVALAQGAQRAREDALTALTAEFEQRLEPLREPGASKRLREAFRAQPAPRAKVGESS